MWSPTIIFAMTTLAAASAGPGHAPTPPISVYAAALRQLAYEGPQIQLWTDRDDGTVYHRGDRVRVYFRTDEDAYVTIFRIDTDGRVRVLFPPDPWDDDFARGGRAYEVRPTDDPYAFLIDEYPGEGYVFAIATRDPFDYREMVRGDHWDYRVIASNGRVAGDPYVAIENLVDMIVPANYDAYSYDVTSYYVEQYYQYPRFLCYDCHSYVAFPYWDPYNYSCQRFRIVIYDDPYYYPARAYPATRVVYRRTGRIEPRYVFKDRTATEPFVVRVRQRPAEPVTRRGEDRGVTGRDLGGVGAVPTPVSGPERRAPDVGAGQGNLMPGRRPDVTGTPTTRPGAVVPDRRPGVEPSPTGRRIVEPTPVSPQPDRRVPMPSAQPERNPTLVPQGPVRREPTAVQEERPRLERREPPASAPQAEPQRRPESPPQATTPKVAPPAKAAPAPQPKKPATPARRKPGG
jgi:hypothetical protein